jgi:hypothetical protein
MPGEDHAQDGQHGLVRGLPDQAERESAEGSLTVTSWIRAC